MADQRPPEGPWNVETVLTHLTTLVESVQTYLVSLIDRVEKHLTTTIESNDKRYDQRFTAQALATDAALAAAERAVLKAEAAAEKRFEGVNEFRSTLADQQRTLIPRSEVEVLMRGMNDKINALEKTLDSSIAERQGQVAALQKTIDASIAQRQGTISGWGYAVALIGVLIGIFGLASRFWGP